VAWGNKEHAGPPRSCHSILEEQISPVEYGGAKIKKLLYTNYGNSTPESSRLVSVLLSLLVLTFAFLLAVRKVYNYDIWWHLQTGQWILETRKIPLADPFTFTTPGAPWWPHYWFSDVLFALVQRMGGIDGLILVKALVVATAFLIVFRLMLREGINSFLAVVLVLLGIYIAQFRFLLRPHVFMFPLAAVFFWMLSVWGNERNVRLLWLLPLMLLWVNLHGSFFLGWVLVGCLLGEGFLAAGYRRVRDKEGIAKWPTFLVLLLALLSIIILINPFGLDLLRWVLTDFSLKNVTRTFEIEEHMALSWGSHPLFWAFMLATALSFLVSFRRARLFHLLVFAATSFLAIRGVRFVALAALFQAFILGYNLQPLLEKLAVRVYRPRPWLQAALGIPLLVGASALLFQHSFAKYKVNRFGLGIDESRFPKAAVEFLVRLNPSGNIYNSWPIGGYLLWRWPDRKIFLDGRSLAAQLELLERLNKMTSVELDAFFQRLDIGAAILSYRDRRFTAYFGRSTHFRLIYFDDRALVFLRNDALPAEQMQRFSFLDLIHPESDDLGYLVAYAQSPMATKVEKELQNAVALAPNSFKPRFLLAFFLEARGRGVEALEQYLAAVRSNPRLAFVHYDLGRRVGRLAVHLKEWTKGTTLLQEAIHFREDAEILFLLGTSLYQAGNTNEAEKVYKEVLRREPRQVACLVNLGYLYHDSERFREAERMHRKALALAPENEMALFGLALALQEEGKKEEAEQRWSEFLNKHPLSPWKSKAIMHKQRLASEGPASN
jgi:tetratricopeptide (TPR) repeat protein